VPAHSRPKDGVLSHAYVSGVLMRRARGSAFLLCWV